MAIATTILMIMIVMAVAGNQTAVVALANFYKNIRHHTRGPYGCSCRPQSTIRHSDIQGPWRIRYIFVNHRSSRFSCSVGSVVALTTGPTGPQCRRIGRSEVIFLQSRLWWNQSAPLFLSLSLSFSLSLSVSVSVSLSLSFRFFFFSLSLLPLPYLLHLICVNSCHEYALLLAGFTNRNVHSSFIQLKQTRLD